MLGRRIGDMLDLAELRRVIYNRGPATHSQVTAGYNAMLEELDSLYKQTGDRHGMPGMCEAQGMAQADGQKSKGEDSWTS